MPASRSVKVLLLTVGNGINILMNFIMMPYLARSLTYEEYGTYGQVLMITALLQVVFTFSLNQMVNLVFADNDNDRKKSFATLFYLSLWISIGGIALLFASSGLISRMFGNIELKNLLLYSGVFLGGQIIYTVLFSILIYHDKVKQASVLLITSNIARLLLIFIAIHYYHSLERMIISLSIVSVLQVLMAIYFLPSEVKSFTGYDSGIARYIFKMAYPLTLSGITERGIFYIDGIIISTLLTTGDYALYRAGAFEVPFISSLYGSVSSIVMPEISRLYNSGRWKEITLLKRRTITGNACLIYPVLIFLLFFDKTLLTSYLSDKYAASVPVFALFNLALLIRVNDYQDILVVSGNTRYIFIYSVLMFVLNFVLNCILVKYYGIIGGAVAFISFLFLYAGLLAHKSAKVLKQDVSDIFDFKKLISILAVSIIFIQPFYWAHHFTQFNIIFVGVSAALFLFTVYFFLWKVKLLENELLNRMVGKFRQGKNK